ncbi:MAG: pantoate--beta-alanine ligase [Chitinophagaceae bacterium]
MMILFKKINDLRNYLDSQRKIGNKIGFVPTMGALHDGHLSLITGSKKENQVTVCSIFVNPAQFNDPKDFEKYPITTDRDIALLEPAGCEVLFLPSVTEIYPAGPGGGQHYDLGYLETLLEGKYRPGHFQGVCKVVHRLLDIVRPDNLYLGQKDYQQCMVISRLLEITGLGRHTTIHICPTLREKDGLAMSSRNMRLNETERKQAVTIYQCLQHIKTSLKPGHTTSLILEATQTLEKAGFKPDYVAIADAFTLEPVEHWDGRQDIVALIAAYLNEVRLIDNLSIT